MGRLVRLLVFEFFVRGEMGVCKVGAQGPPFIVQAGEIMFRIALRFGVTVESLAAANGIVDVTHVYVGQVLIIPTGVVPQPQTDPAQPQPQQPLPQEPQPQQPVPANTGGPVYYTVQVGDTLNII